MVAPPLLKATHHFRLWDNWPDILLVDTKLNNRNISY